MQADGSQQRQLTAGEGGNTQPAVTSDERLVIFVSSRTGSNQIWRMNIDGSNQRQLTSGSGKAFPAVSTDGKWILYNTTDDWHLWKLSIDGGEPVRLTQFVALRPAVSPDGNTIACLTRNESRGELLILPFDGGSPLKRFDATGWAARVQWTPDGKALVYATQSNAAQIVKQPLDGSAPSKIVEFDEGVFFDFGYSPDRRFMAVIRGGWQHDIVLISGLNRR